MHVQGDYSFAGLFPLHYTQKPNDGFPALVPCDQGRPNKHAVHLMQAMRFAVEEINNASGPLHLLPGVKLGYQIYDICSIPASILATLDLLAQQYQNPHVSETGQALLNSSETQIAVGVIGPDSSSKTFTPAALLGSFLVPEVNLKLTNLICLMFRKHKRSLLLSLQISYEASNEMLSNKFLYPSFFRTIPSDKNQVTAMIQLLVRFNWTWVALLGSDNDYGLQGMQSLSQQAPNHGICIAYQGIIPAARAEKVQTMRNMVENILTTKVNTIVVFSSKTIFHDFLPFVLERNITDKVWIGTEDWSPVYVHIGDPWHQHHRHRGGSKKEVEESIKYIKDDSGATKSSPNDCLQSADLYTLVSKNYSMDEYDTTSSFNVYKAVYAMAYALHNTLGCDSGKCSRRSVSPQELLPSLKKVRFSLSNSSVYFDANGDPPTGYDIVSWVWRGTEWSLRVVGSFTPDPVRLFVDTDRIQCRCLSALLRAQRATKKLLTGQHTCCFDCLPCPAATFLNLSDPTECQPCLPEQWAPPTSEQCLSRTVLLLAWDDPLSIALLFFLATCLLLTSSTAVILLVNLNTPVAKSAGGRTCLLMLAALTVAALSTLCHFGEPSPLGCILKQPLFTVSFSVCLACITVRSLQVVCIFKFSSKLPPAYDNYMGKDLPANYNEAKCVTFSLMVYKISWISFFTLYLINRETFTMAAQVFATLFSVLAFIGGYFVPKIYIIVLRPKMNTTAHFQNCIQMYTMNK
ncbi:Taste receptor type 1 member 1 [Oryzias melastigma]|uniref:Taste receptor type 1 member 1 n=1 Tax=Oryzias melastigma TaxID=30732 RepID=A0A834FJS7_ORYME|nr:Taste receptor type 1 member 1 [Oryzias melastigma]